MRKGLKIIKKSSPLKNLAMTRSPSASCSSLPLSALRPSPSPPPVLTKKRSILIPKNKKKSPHQLLKLDI